MYHHIRKHWRINLYLKGIKSDDVNFILLKERFFCHLSIGLPSVKPKKSLTASINMKLPGIIPAKLYPKNYSTNFTFCASRGLAAGASSG